MKQDSTLLLFHNQTQMPLLASLSSGLFRPCEWVRTIIVGGSASLAGKACEAAKGKGKAKSSIDMFHLFFLASEKIKKYYCTNYQVVKCFMVHKA